MARNQSLILGGDFSVLLLLCILSWSSNYLITVSGELKKGECINFFFHTPTTATSDYGVQVPAASYNISAIYCPPTKYVPHRSSTVQLLVHGGTSNKHYWSALAPVGSGLEYQPYNYSWVDFARAEGYHIVAIDRFGYGNSTRPNSALVRVPQQLQSLLEIILALRRGGCVDGVPKFEKIIGVGHSLGAFYFGLILPAHPFVLDATVMISFVIKFDLATSNNASGKQIFSPAREVFPKRFADLDSGYVYLLNPRTAFFSKDGEFDPAIPPLDYLRADAQADGEDASIMALAKDPKTPTYFNVTSTGFKGDVVFVTGSEDKVFCGGDCGSGPDNYVSQSLAYYSSAKGHRGAFEIPKCGHLLHYHYVARGAFETAHNWLAESGY